MMHGKLMVDLIATEAHYRSNQQLVDVRAAVVTSVAVPPEV